MVLLFSNRKNKLEKEIIEILTACGGDFISDKAVHITGGLFTVNIFYKKTDIEAQKGIVLLLDDTARFENQEIPKGLIAVCEENNRKALEIIKNSGAPVVTCGINPKNTLTVVGFEKESFIISLQREITDINGKTVLPFDFKINFAKNHSPQAIIMCCAIILLLGLDITSH